MAARSILITLGVCLVVTAFPMCVRAESINDVFSIYGVEDRAELPNDISSVIQKYNDAKRYAFQYTGIANANYDTEVLSEKLKRLESERSKVESRLLQGYNLLISECQLLEDEYLAITKQIEETEQSLNTTKTLTVDFAFDDVPTAIEYNNALQQKESWLQGIEIGEVKDIHVPIIGEFDIVDCNNNRTVYTTKENAVVQSPFKGDVSDVFVDDSYGLTVVIDCGNGLVSYICNLEEAIVELGDELLQYQNVGIVSNSTAVFCLEINGDLVNFAKLFVKEVSS